MALNEFELIRRYFSHIAPIPADQNAICLGVGDDAALIRLPEQHELVLSMDTQVAGVHFPLEAPAASIAQRAFRCALSDLAAMGAEPLCFTLALTLPTADESWLQSFSEGLKNVATEYRCPLVGGDTTKGPLAITLQVHGTLPTGSALRRSGAKVGDVILVSGFLGSAAAYVELMQQQRLGDPAFAHAGELFGAEYFFPSPRIALGKALRAHARSAIDISDGLLADLGHICQASKLNARIELERIPRLPELSAAFGATRALQLALCGGDDYELCFTAPENKVRKIQSLAEDMECPVTVIGAMLDTPFHKEQPLACYHGDGSLFDITTLQTSGYQHF